MLPVLDETTERGVHNPRVIDLIAFDQSADVVRIHLIEFRPWEETRSRFEQLQDKFNNYLDYVLDGYLVEQYPQYRNKKVNFVLECSSEPSRQFAELIEAMRRFAKNAGFELEVLLNERGLGHEKI